MGEVPKDDNNEESSKEPEYDENFVLPRKRYSRSFDNIKEQ